MEDKRKATAAQTLLGDITPGLADLTDDVLFGQVWERPGLSKRDRSLITCAALVVLGHTAQMGSHVPRALANGITREELSELVTHLAFYGGWPAGVSAAVRLKEILASLPEEEKRK